LPPLLLLARARTDDFAATPLCTMVFCAKASDRLRRAAGVPLLLFCRTPFVASAARRATSSSMVVSAAGIRAERLQPFVHKPG
jgi:hypothetical protein